MWIICDTKLWDSWFIHLHLNQLYLNTKPAIFEIIQYMFWLKTHIKIYWYKIYRQIVVPKLRKSRSDLVLYIGLKFTSFMGNSRHYDEMSKTKSGSFLSEGYDFRKLEVIFANYSFSALFRI